MLGLNIQVSALCFQEATKYIVTRHKTPKRRRRWTVKKIVYPEPCSYQTPDGTIYMHPIIYERLKLHAAAQGGKQP